MAVAPRQQAQSSDIDFHSPDEVGSATLARWLVYGEVGTGKSTLVSSAPPDMPIIVANTNTENIKPYRGRKNIRIVHIRRWDQMGDLFLKLRGLTMVKEGGMYVPRPGLKQMLVSFDTLSRLQALAMRKVLGKDTVWSEDDAWKNMTQAIKMGGNYDFWGSVAALMVEAVTQFDTLPIHVLWLCQELDREPKYEHSAAVTTGPMLTPAATNGIKEIVEMVGRLYVIEDTEGRDDTLDLKGASKSFEINAQMKEKRMLLIGKHPRYIAKGDTRKLGYVVENPTWSKLAVTLGGESGD